MKSFIEQFELTEFSNNNFAIIVRILYIATQYEKTFRTYFNKEPTLIDINSEIYKIYDWVVHI